MNDYMALALLALGGFLISQAVYDGCGTYLREIKLAAAEKQLPDFTASKRNNSRFREFF